MTSPPWKPTLGDGHPRLSVLFPRKACHECADRLKYTGNVDGKGRHVFLMPQPLQEIQTRNRAEQTTAECGADGRPFALAARPLPPKPFMPTACGTAATAA
ncbi:hypothetical protein ACF08N_16960 [Streptomyces sp. NPDC015127]|uniref:hypothetical protein n=1 Tax=Streptomyces sp. NPDC015127 TaxID=3364939 RepID=UPI0036F6F5FF